jgi:hypothetical protein
VAPRYGATDVARAGSFHQLYIWRATAIGAPTLLAALLLLRSPPRCPLARHFHVPCPGCGLTRAARFLFAGDFPASLRLQPLLVPLMLAVGSLGIGMVVATLVRGSPGGMVDTRAGRLVLGFAVVVMVLTIALWIARFAGFFGGPVPV